MLVVIERSGHVLLPGPDCSIDVSPCVRGNVLEFLHKPSITRMHDKHAVIPGTDMVIGSIISDSCMRIR